MANEFIFDISPGIKSQTLETLSHLVTPPTTPMDYLTLRLNEYRNAPSIAPLYNAIIRGAYESSDETLIRLLGSFTTLDAVVFEHERQNRWFEITDSDHRRFQIFSDNYLVDRRWHDPKIVEGGFVKDIKAYMKLMHESGGKGPTVNISHLLEALSKNGKHNLSDTVVDGSQILAEGQKDLIRTEEDYDEVVNMFRRGGWPVIAMVTVKYGGQMIENLLLEDRANSGKN